MAWSGPREKVQHGCCGRRAKVTTEDIPVEHLRRIGEVDELIRLPKGVAREDVHGDEEPWHEFDKTFHTKSTRSESSEITCIFEALRSFDDRSLLHWPANNFGSHAEKPIEA